MQGVNHDLGLAPVSSVFEEIQSHLRSRSLSDGS